MVALREITADERQTVNGADPDAIYPVPTAWNEDEEYQLAPDLERIGRALIGSCEELAHLNGAEVRFVWAKKGPTKAGRPILGRCLKPASLLKWFTDADFVVVLSCDHCTAFTLTNWQLEALLFHECLHADWDAKTDKPTTRGHDVEMFHQEVARYGLWLHDLREAKETFDQVSMF